uniref:Sulfotransferase domain-containing protein n=1 Tax=Corethron hystrix TaxID=216773 RepID=A0A7S1BC41_9STRA|mmetsp:Transcript_21366/g.48531  ORF Transcript_21366/g.48531 Transcript_21366/m.48531 type:complete len:304 (+) Transcript_21366:399-1310(+)|eukprot:CAMPEP_0113298134 /NCGR_PEP_ID=MMETSP0010_2-20120614/705_1 /TAXON_ID=216773 ORGANISM="Corethron hystrix, Strain 308" /NCGR_SAMPLE_ID=MMETSP0010_2 /ASSEMBLY_ACC=CAM_ASM_000155 /LENGTH=303 /DNA_ID=CAMNT_0000151137 /DNA_START=296 /DNA_END=1207 /DNA_ORIENTATION=+ /assembly_acc=CAM_ASM_000155
MPFLFNVLIWCGIFSLRVAAEIQVIGTGSGRTGTTTLHEALSILGYKTYHVKEILTSGRTSDIDYWLNAYSKNCSDPEGLRKLFESGEYGASAHAIHFPCLEKMLFDLYPNARVIHTERKDAEQWHNSVSNSICIQDSKSFRIMEVIGFFVPTIRRVRNQIIPHLFAMVMFGSAQPIEVSKISKDFCLGRKEEMIAHYHAHNARIKTTVPKKRLLVITNHKQGWEPICNFLGKEIPDVPYPHLNKRDSMFVEILTKVIGNNPTIAKYAEWCGLLGVGLLLRILLKRRRAFLRLKYESESKKKD